MTRITTYHPIRGGVSSTVERNRVLRNSYWLLALSMVPSSAFILYDLKRVQDGHETKYITATLGVYLSLYNVFQSLLALLGIAGGRDE